MCANWLFTQATARHPGQSRQECEATTTPKTTHRVLRRLLAARAPSPRSRRSPRDMSFLLNAGVFKRGQRIDPRARLRGRVTDNEFRSFVDNCLKVNKSPGPDGYSNESVKTMSHTELEILREWANEILAMEKARVMTVEEMNGTIRLLHKGGVTDDRPQDWRPVVLLNCTNQLVMHILNARLRNIVEKAGILAPGQAGGRQGRSTDINLTKLLMPCRRRRSGQ
jgi:hypothetical protein